MSIKFMGHSVLRKRQAKRGHFLAVAHEQNVADQHRMIPRLSLYCTELCYLCELFWLCASWFRLCRRM
jgi:hypothetical protein